MALRTIFYGLMQALRAYPHGSQVPTYPKVSWAIANHTGLCLKTLAAAPLDLLTGAGLVVPNQGSSLSMQRAD